MPGRADGCVSGTRIRSDTLVSVALRRWRKRARTDPASIASYPSAPRSADIAVPPTACPKNCHSCRIVASFRSWRCLPATIGRRRCPKQEQCCQTRPTAGATPAELDRCRLLVDRRFDGMERWWNRQSKPSRHGAHTSSIGNLQSPISRCEILACPPRCGV
jgi:hypothetical protein